MVAAHVTTEHRVSRLIFRFAAALALAVPTAAGCTSNPISEANELADEACACDDAACAQEVVADYGEFLDEVAAETLSEDEENQLAAAAERFSECVAPYAADDARD